MKTFSDYTDALLALVQEARTIPLGGYRPIKWPILRPGAPNVLQIVAHADDESVTAEAVFRLRCAGFPIINMTMKLGRPGTQACRLEELRGACTYLGFEMVVPNNRNGFESISDTLRGTREWAVIVQEIIGFLHSKAPAIIVTHHTRDGHHGHRGTALAVREAIASVKWDGTLFETDYWLDMEEPNLMLEVTKQDLDQMLEALSFHKSQLERNEYHLTLPDDLRRTVRRSEIILGGNTKTPPFSFACMYRHNRCVAGTIIPTTEKRVVAAQASIAYLL